MEYAGKIVVVTGVGQGIGKEIARRFLLAKATVIGFEVNADLKQQVSAELQSVGQFRWVDCDMADPISIKQAVTSLEQQSRVDVLVNNAAVAANKPLTELSVEEWDWVQAVNLRGPFLLTRELIPKFSKAQGPVVINIASTRALMSEANTEAYSASKGGLVALTHALAISLSSYGARVVAISPGWIETDPHAKHTTEDSNQHPVGRVGKPCDIAEACLYLASCQASFITGTNLVIDGGMTVKMIYAD